MTSSNPDRASRRRQLPAPGMHDSRPRKRALTVARVGAIFSMGALAACASGEENAGVVIQTTPAEFRDLRITAEASGELEPVRKVEVKSKASGEILQLYVDSGDEVEPGALLASVDPRDVENAHDQAVADLDVAEARLAIAQARLDRSAELLESEVITAQEYESQELENANALAALVRAQTNLELAELRLTDVTIRAPMAGTILEKSVEDGQVIQSATGNVSGGTTLFVMANLADMRVRTLVDETDVGQLTAGMTATVSVEAFSDRTFQGEIEKVEPQAVVVQNVTMFPVIVLLDNRAGLLKPGMNAEVEVLVDQRIATLTVPNNAVVQPRELAPAAEVLGLDPQSVSIDRTAWGALMAQAAARAGGAGTPNSGIPGAGPSATRQGGGPGGSALAGIRARLESGEITQDSARTLFASVRNRRQDQGGEAPLAAEAPDGERAGGRDPISGGPAVSPQGGNGTGGGWGVALGGSTGDPAYQPAVAFVVDQAGNIEARPVIMGLSDWDYAEIVAGLEEGEELALIGAAQLQAQQQDRINRIRNRMGGRPFGG